MSRIQQQINPLIADELRQAFGTAVATHANLAIQVRRYSTDTRQAIDVSWAEGPGNRQGLGHAAQQQNALH
ncbi:hypothetical protein D3C76_1554970 [compost metagenome]